MNIKPAKIGDVEKLIKTHYGDEWSSLEKLSYFKDVISAYHPATDLVDEEVLCEPQNEQDAFQINLVSV